MKKLFTLVLALVMVFAIAAPAMAAWGAPDATVGAPYTLTVTAVQANTDAYGNTYYTAFPANGAVVAGTPVKAMIEVTLPSQVKLDAQYGKQNAATDFGLWFEPTNLKLASIDAQSRTIGTGNADNTYKFLAANTTGTNAKTIAGKLIADPAKTTVYTAIVNYTVKETKAAKLEVTLGYDAAEGILTGTPTDAEEPVALIADEVKLGGSFTLSMTVTPDYDYTGDAVITAKSGNQLILGLNEDGKVIKWNIKVGADTYEILGSVFVLAGQNTIVRPDVEDQEELYAKLTAAVKVFSDKFGFKPGETVYFTDENIAGTFGVSGTVSAFVEWKPYTTSLTVTDTAAVPNTGDSVSVIGFVMVGLALLATAAVVVKKVRA